MREGLDDDLAKDFSDAEVDDIKRAIGEADADLARDLGIPSSRFFADLGQ